MKRLVLGIWLVVSGLYADGIYATFSIEAKQSANLAFSSSGIIKKLLVDVTSEVKRGDVLAKLDNDDLKSMVKISKISLKYAKQDYQRQLKVKSMIDKAKLDRYEFKYENAKAQLAYQQSMLDKTILKAPFDGVIYEKKAEVGDVVTGMNPKTVFKLQSKTKRKLLLSFDQKYWQDVKVGDSFEYKVDGSDKVYKSKISKIYPSADINSRKIKAEVEVDGFVVGLFGDGYIKCIN